MSQFPFWPATENCQFDMITRIRIFTNLHESDGREEENQVDIVF